jgi:thioredoxin-like negative regulator of GroEL
MLPTSPQSVARWVLIAAAFAPAGATAAEPTAIRWRTDYNAARKEAQEKGLPILVDVGTDDCFYCQKLETTTFKDTGIAKMLTGQFVPLKIDGNKEPGLARALSVQVYPTIVLAGPDGKIHHILQGYQTADQLRDYMKQSATTTTAEIVVKATTGGAATGDKANLARARELLGLAKDEFRGERYAACLEHCEYLAAVYADQPEGREAATLIAQIKGDPDRLAVASEQMNERAVGLQLALADAHLKRGNTQDAAACFEKVARLAANKKTAEFAEAQLAQLKAAPGSVPAGLRK